MSFNVATVSPGFNSVTAYLDAVIIVTFNENLLATSVNEFTFNLVSSETNIAVEGTVTVTGNKTIQFTPAADLLGNTRYTVIVMGNAWGVLSAGSAELPETVSWNFTTSLYVDSADTVDSIPTAVDPALEPTTDELYLVSSVPDNSAVNVLGDNVALTFTGLVPSGTSVDIAASHPLGYPAGDNYWADNYKLIINGNQLTIASSGDLATALNNSVEFITNEALITESSIIVSESGHAQGSIRPVRFGMDSNFLYTIKVNIPTNTFVPKIDFVSKLLPQLVTVEELRLFSGAVLNRFNDFTLSTLLYKISLTAKGLWESHGFTWPTITPYYASKYVLNRGLRDMMTIVLRDTSSPGGTSQKLGELSLGSRPDSDALIDDLRNLDLMVTLLGQKLSEGSTSVIPFAGPAWVETGKEGGSAVIGSNAIDASGREAPMYRDNWSRDIEEKTR